MFFPDPMVDPVGDAAVERDDFGRNVVAGDDNRRVEFALHQRGKWSIPVIASI